MAKENETIADIIAEMKREAAQIFPALPIAVLRLATRIEAAHNREAAFHAMTCEANDRLREHLQIALDANKREVGNAAKLREALCEILSYIESFHKYIIPGKREKTTALFAVADTILGMARAALAAPPRNCDRFANAVEAMAELKRVHSYCAKENRRCLEDCPDCGKEWCSLAWLFAPATESEAAK